MFEIIELMNNYQITEEAVAAAAAVIRTVDYPDYQPDHDLARRVLEAAAEFLADRAPGLCATIAEVDELPSGSVIQSGETVGRKDEEGLWWVTYFDDYVDSSYFELPATVLYRPVAPRG